MQQGKPEHAPAEERSCALCRQARVDALAALAACAEGYGAAPMEPFLPSVWDALRDVLLAPGAPALAPEAKEQVRSCCCCRCCCD
jgi:hypothetical protein